MADRKNVPAKAKNQVTEPAKAAPVPQAAKAVEAKPVTPVAAKPAAPAVKAAEPAPKAPAVAAKAPAVAEKASAPAIVPAVRAPAQAPKPVAATPVVRAAQPAPKAAAKPINVKTKPVLTNIDSGAKIMTDTIQKTQEATKQVAEKATEQFRAAATKANEQGKVAMEKGARVVEEMADLTRGNLEAMVASQKTAAKYAETLSQGAADYGRRSFEQASATLKSFAEVKSPTDFFRLQSEFARSAFDQFVAEGSRVTETVVKMSNDVAEPLASRYAVASERMKAVAA